MISIPLAEALDSSQSPEAGIFVVNEGIAVASNYSIVHRSERVEIEALPELSTAGRQATSKMLAEFIEDMFKTQTPPSRVHRGVLSSDWMADSLINAPSSNLNIAQIPLHCRGTRLPSNETLESANVQPSGLIALGEPT